MPTRREFLATAAVAAIRPPLPRLKKAVKYSMIQPGDGPADKLALVKRLGFAGVEIDRPSKLDLAALVAARDATGVQVHGVIDSVHWQDTLSHPDAAVRAKGLAALKGAIADAKTVGADTVLLVPGVARNGVSYQECWDRSTAEVKKAIPDADAAGVKIAIEVVWNDFLTKPEQLCEYVDQFRTPTVGAYFDCSNMLKYGVPAATWVRTLGKRMLKLDFKGWSKSQGFKAAIGEGDEDWPEVLKACGEVGYHGWATAEVKAGDEAWLADVSKRMDKILQLG